MIFYYFAFLLIPFLGSVYSQDSKPNIIFILADDLGWNDVGYHNHEENILSPNIDRLASEGVTFARSYVQPICTPSRSSLLTGMYPYKIGRQGGPPLGPDQPTGLTLNYTLLPDYLKQAGYATHMVGKWHVGHCKHEFLPNQRGFDSFMGYWGGAEDYFTKSSGPPQSHYYDFHTNNEPFAPKDTTTYSMDLYSSHVSEILEAHPKDTPMFLYLALQTVHAPIQVPEAYTEMQDPTIEEPRRTYLGMVTAMDDVVGNITESLIAHDLYDNSVIIFVSDNGGQIGGQNPAASNLPLRAGKGSIYEGGVRTPAFMHSPLLPQEKKGTKNTNMMHISDWLPTLLSLAQAEASIPQNIDGIDQSSAIFGDEPAPRNLLVNEFALLTRPNGHDLVHGAMQIEDGWKLIMNPERHPGAQDVYELYNVHTDPKESIDLLNDYPELVQTMQAQMQELLKEMVPQDSPDSVDHDLIVDDQGNLASGWC